MTPIHVDPVRIAVEDARDAAANLEPGPDLPQRIADTRAALDRLEKAHADEEARR